MESRETISEEEFNAKVKTAGDALDAAFEQWRELWEHILQDRDIVDDGELAGVLAMRRNATPPLIARLFNASYPEADLHLAVFIGTESETKQIYELVAEHGPQLEPQQ